jgi:hypothetical protein
MYKSNRLIDGKPRWIIVDKFGYIANGNPTKVELNNLKTELSMREKCKYKEL